MIELFTYTLTPIDLLITSTVALLIGMAKTGIAGAGMIAVPILAIVFGGKDSTGIMLPLLIIADIFAVCYYHKHADWQHLRRLLPFSVVGILIGTLMGEAINDAIFKQFMVIIIVLSLSIMIWQEQHKGTNTEPTFLRLFGSTLGTSGMGIAGGIATMIGNLAGPIMALYLLAMRLPKSAFIGTAAWFFMTVNVIKVPFHVIVWETITFNSIYLTLIFTPIVAVGAWVGIKLVALFPERTFRHFVIGMTAVAAFAMLF